MLAKRVSQTMSEDWIIKVEKTRTAVSDSFFLAIAFLLIFGLGPLFAVAWNKALVRNVG